MKRTITTIALTALISFFISSVYGQSAKYLNFGGLGTGLYASLEFPVGSAITVAPLVATDYELNKIIIAAKGSYYFDDIFGLNETWDAYAGVNVGWRIESNSNDDGGNFGIHIGGRWFWTEKWGVNAEFGGGSGVLGGAGITMKM